MLIGFIALITMIDWILIHIGHIFNPDFNLSLDWVFGKLFYPMAWAMGVPGEDVNSVATLLGQKLTINEFVAFQNLANKTVPIVSEKGLLICSIAICGFANFSSVGMQIGGIGAVGRADAQRQAGGGDAAVADVVEQVADRAAGRQADRRGRDLAAQGERARAVAVRHRPPRERRQSSAAAQSAS
jgi:nucleoside permease NupC